MHESIGRCLQKINLRIKWPNDIYYGDKLKLGGVLIKSSVIGNMVHINLGKLENIFRFKPIYIMFSRLTTIEFFVILGCGVNISNKDPTTCLNDIILQHNNNCSSPDSHLQPFAVEEFVARLITQIEHLIRQFQEDFGDSFYDLYHQHWLHRYCTVNFNYANTPNHS